MPTFLNPSRRRTCSLLFAPATHRELGATLSNDLTDAALSLRPELRGALDLGLEADALGAVVSGSGPTCLFLAEDEAHSLDIAIALAGAGVCADVIQARGPVAGARLI